ncbi:MAG: 6-bladed beta-propeller [Pirellulaceae bacterium]|nr:6-bladed beta-propeller [Pirellulaceae bacterium]
MCYHWTKQFCLLTVVLFVTVAVASDPINDGKTPYSAEAAEPTQGVSEKPAQATRPAYPRVTPSIWYEVDPDWPRRPKDMSWGGTPGVAVDDKDQVWVFTRAERPVQVYSADGKFLRSWGEELIGRRESSVGSHSIKIDREGMIWLADCINHVILQVTPDGKLLKTLGTPGEAGCDESHLNMPTDMAVTPQGEVFVADGYGNARIVHFDAKGQFVKAWGTLGTGPGEFNVPHAIVLDSEGTLYVADRNNARVQVFDQNGKFLNQWRNLIIPWGLWITVDNEIWVCGCSPMPWLESDGDYLSCPPKDQILMRFSRCGKALQLWTAPKGKDNEEKPGELNWVHGIAVDSKGNLYVADIMGKRVQKFVRHN